MDLETRRRIYRDLTAEMFRSNGIRQVDLSADDCGLSFYEIQKEKEHIRELYREKFLSYVNERTKVQQTFTRMCIKCHEIFAYKHEECYRTVCPGCRA